ncbi:acyltransferase [Fibrella sp. USSR17]
MGLLKLLLAAMVVFVHAGPLISFPTMGGSLAVQTFYIISGFYMALILNEKYVTQPDAYRLFLTNRVLRLLPLYYVVVGLTLLTALIMVVTLGQAELESFQALRKHYPHLSASTLALVAFTNVTLIGQDWLSFLSVNPATGTLVFSSDFNQAPVDLTRLLLVRPAWTVGLEITFYIVAPLIVRRRTWVLLLVILLSAGIRFALRRYANFDSMAWSYRFFPSELMYFVAGALSYKVYRRLNLSNVPTWIYQLALIITLLYTFFFGLVHNQLVDLGLPGGVSSALYRLTIIATLPFVFLYTKQNRLDAKIGELSYPLYILHFLIWEILRTWNIGGDYINLYTLVIALAGAYLLTKLVGDRIEQLRRRVFEQHSRVRPATV